MKPNGRNNISISQHSLEKLVPFKRGPIKFVTYLPVAALPPVLMIFLNGETYVRKMPFQLEIEDDHNFIEFKILDCDEEEFTNFFVSFGPYRVEIKFSRSNKKNNVYKLFPSGVITRVTNGDK